MNGAMAPFISETYQLSPTEKGVMLSIPIFTGALMRFPLGVLARYTGRKNATLVGMGLIMAPAVRLLLRRLVRQSSWRCVCCLGIAGACFGVALHLGSGSFPARYKGLAMGLLGTGNVATASPHAGRGGGQGAMHQHDS